MFYETNTQMFKNSNGQDGNQNELAKFTVKNVGAHVRNHKHI